MFKIEISKKALDYIYNKNKPFEQNELLKELDKFVLAIFYYSGGS